MNYNFELDYYKKKTHTQRKYIHNTSKRKLKPPKKVSLDSPNRKSQTHTQKKNIRKLTFKVGVSTDSGHIYFNILSNKKESIWFI